MDNQLTIETPEQTRLEFPLAGIGSRFLALGLDTLIQLAATLVLSLAGVLIFSGMVRSPAGGLWALAVFVLFLFLLQFGYFAFFEAVWNGQTPGKRRQHLRVMKASGQPLTSFDAVTRNLLRLVDSLPGFYAVGIVSALLSSKNQRLGDYVAGTVVVHERPLEERAEVRLSYAEGGGAPRYDVSRLAPEEFQLIEAYLMRRAQLSPEVRFKITRQIVERIAGRLEIPPDDQRRPEPLLERLCAEYRNRARFG